MPVVACLTSSGNTPKLMSRSRSALPIYALASDRRTLAKVALYRGVHPVLFEADDIDYDRINEEAVAWLQRDGAVRRRRILRNEHERVLAEESQHRAMRRG